MARPSISAQRLSRAGNGNVTVALKRPYGDGASHVVFSAIEFMECLAALILKPRLSLTRLPGVFSSNRKLRFFKSTDIWDWMKPLAAQRTFRVIGAANRHPLTPHYRHRRHCLTKICFQTGLTPMRLVHCLLPPDRAPSFPGLFGAPRSLSRNQ
ncbi:MAG: transposase [Pseudomonadales bacterium]|nr:transposase [Pseudomonadales bacterium]MBO6563269.1 transposase [Pseudomonadales bacterium]MBO6594615.1 transposase [Pseudomonadales bacterium]MBO6655458.1 transposase [Pseudomonadales bacterium]MBO6821825.1 transposase [Pseudomonadales bacterium]